MTWYHPSRQRRSNLSRLRSSCASSRAGLSAVDIIHRIKVFQHLVTKGDIIPWFASKKSILLRLDAFCFVSLGFVAPFPGNVTIVPMPSHEIGGFRVTLQMAIIDRCPTDGFAQRTTRWRINFSIENCGRAVIRSRRAN